MNYTINDLLSLYEDANFYDIEFSKRSIDINFFKEYCTNFSGKILEIACGTGRITNEITKVASNVEGRDISESMINKAKQNYKEIPFSVEDMLSTTGVFDLIFCATNAFQHILDNQSVLKALENIKLALDSKGKFLLDIQNPNEIKLKRNLNIPYKYKDFLYKGEKIEAYINGHYNNESSIYYFNIDYRKKEISFKNKSVAMRMFTHKKILKLISNSGFKVDECYGCYSKSKYTSNSDKQIFVLSKV